YRKMDNVQSYVFDDGEITDGFGFSFKHAGYFDVELEEDVLAAAPLGIYGLQKTHLKDDPEKSIHPTSIPGSFLSTPAHGLISLEWAEELKGEAPIDAIRVRVAGIDGYDEQASAKIKALAAEFEADGFTVDIVAGASHQSLTMDVEGLGTVVQPWTTLGAADTILHSWNLVRIVLVILFTLVCLIYTLSRLIYLQKARQPEEEQLRQFGWGEREIVQLRRQEWRRLIGYPFAISLLVLLAYASYTGIWELLAYSGMLLVVLLVLVFVSIFVTEKQAPHRTIPAVKGPLPFQNAWYYRNIVLAAILQLAITTFISVFLTLFLQQEQARTTLTNLGIYVHGEMEWYYVILLALLYTLTALTVVETLAELWKKREKEISLLKQIGWGTSKLSLFYLKEVAVWNGISVVGAALVAIGSFAYLTGDVLGQLPIVFALSAAVYLAFLLAAWLVFRIVERALRMA
ncbi:putative ABC transport system permease protein, partial [Evansella caseinilytica]